MKSFSLTAFFKAMLKYHRVACLILVFFFALVIYSAFLEMITYSEIVCSELNSAEYVLDY